MKSIHYDGTECPGDCKCVNRELVGCRENLDATLESEARNIARAEKAEADNARLRETVALLEKRVEHYAEDGVRLRALIKATEFEGGSRHPGSCPWCGQWKTHHDCPAFSPDGEVK